MPEAAGQIARVLPVVGGVSTGEAGRDAREVAERVEGLVEGLGLRRTLTMVRPLLAFLVLSSAPFFPRRVPCRALELPAATLAPVDCDFAALGGWLTPNHAVQRPARRRGGGRHRVALRQGERPPGRRSP